MKKQQHKKKLKMPKTEKGNIENFLKIKHAIPLGLKDYFAFVVRAVVGAAIIPIFFKLSIEALLELLATIFEIKAPSMLPILSSVQNIFETLQWFVYATLVSVYWFRCNVRLYNFRFTNDVVRKIRAQSSLSGSLRCPRCGYTMTVRSFSEKGKVHTGDRTEYDLEQYRVGNEYRVRTVKKVVPEYRDVEYERQYAMCQSHYCLFEEKKPYGKDSVNYKFFEMPYRISDTLHYAVWTKNDTERLTGNLCRYRHGLSVFKYLLMTVLIMAMSIWRGYGNINFLFRKSELIATLTNLGIYLGVALGISVLLQIAVYITRKESL